MVEGWSAQVFRSLGVLLASALACLAAGPYEFRRHKGQGGGH